MEGIHNHYESLLHNEIRRRHLDQAYDEDALCDLTCTALNQLPAKYVRSEIDLLFYIEPDEREAMLVTTRKAVDYALQQLQKRAG